MWFIAYTQEIKKTPYSDFKHGILMAKGEEQEAKESAMRMLIDMFPMSGFRIFSCKPFEFLEGENAVILCGDIK